MNKNVIEKMYAGSDKVELSEVSVELALADDMKKAYDLSFKELANASAASKKVLASLDELGTAHRQAAIASKQVNDIYDTMTKQAKDLGVELPANIVKMNTDATANLKDSQAKMVNVQNLKKSL